MARPGQQGTQRVRYFEGQLLTPGDLQDDVAYETWLRGLHVGALHDTWGIALGYEVSVSNDQSTALVGPGIAYDYRGREILSSRTIAVRPPSLSANQAAQGGWFDLVMRYHDLATLLGEHPQRELCLGGGGHPANERPAIRWVFAGAATEADEPDLAPAIRLGEDLPLARFRVSASGAFGEPGFLFRRHAQGRVRPHIADGQVVDGLTFDEDTVAWTMTVDTSAGGFSRTPFYFVRLDEHPLLTLLLRFTRDDSVSLAGFRRLLGPFVSVRSPGRTSFQVDVRFAATPNPIGSTETGVLPTIVVRPGQSFQLPATVHWVGIEPVGGCAPPVQPLFAVLLSGFFLQATVVNVLAQGTVGGTPFVTRSRSNP